MLLVRERGDGDPQKRVGFTATKKIGNAVIRNRIKRRFRALAREVIPERGIGGADHVMIGRSAAIDREDSVLRQDLERALAKVGR